MSKNFTVKKTLYTSMTAIALLGAGAATTGVALMSQGATQTVHAASGSSEMDPHTYTKGSDGFYHAVLNGGVSDEAFTKFTMIEKSDDGKYNDVQFKDAYVLTQNGVPFGYEVPEGYKVKSISGGTFTYYQPTGTIKGSLNSGDVTMVINITKGSDDQSTDFGPDAKDHNYGSDTFGTDDEGNITVTPEDKGGASTDTPVQENTDTSTPTPDTTETPDSQGSTDNTDTTSDNKTPITGADFDETWLSPEGYQFAISAASNRPKFIPGTHSTEFNPGQTGDFFNLYDAIQNARNAGPSTGWTSAMIAALQEPYTNAERVFALENAPQAQIDAVTDALNSAVAALDAPTKVDKTDLNDTLSRAVSYQSKEYVDATFQTLQNAIKAAQTINSDTHATQAQVDAASQAVQDAIKGLKSVPDQVISDPGATTDPDDSSSSTGEDGKDTGATAKDDGTSIPNFEEIDLKKDPNQFSQNGNGSDSTSTGDTPAKKDDSQKPTSAAKATPKAKTAPKAKADTKHNDQNTFPKTGEVATNFDLFGTVVIALSALLGITYKKQRN